MARHYVIDLSFIYQKALKYNKFYIIVSHQIVVFRLQVFFLAKKKIWKNN